MILEQINTPSGTPINIDSHDHPPPPNLSETLPPQLFPSTAIHSHPVEVSSSSTSVSIEAFLAITPGTETVVGDGLGVMVRTSVFFGKCSRG